MFGAAINRKEISVFIHMGVFMFNWTNSRYTRSNCNEIPVPDDNRHQILQTQHYTGGHDQ